MMIYPLEMVIFHSWFIPFGQIIIVHSPQYPELLGHLDIIRLQIPSSMVRENSEAFIIYPE